MQRQRMNESIQDRATHHPKIFRNKDTDGKDPNM